MAQEDVDYRVGAHATPDADPPEETGQSNPIRAVLVDVNKYLDEQIAKNNSLDYIEPGGEKSVMTVQQQIVARKEIVTNLKNIKTIINKRLKELK